MKKLISWTALTALTVAGIALITSQPPAAKLMAPQLAPIEQTQNDPVACGRCGDGYCNPRCGETAYTCPRDCAVK